MVGVNRLPENLDCALRAIAKDAPIAIPAEDIKKLLLISYVSEKYGGGWMVNSKGRLYLKTFKKC